MTFPRHVPQATLTAGLGGAGPTSNLIASGARAWATATWMTPPRTDSPDAESRISRGSFRGACRPRRSAAATLTAAGCARANCLGGAGAARAGSAAGPTRPGARLTDQPPSAAAATTTAPPTATRIGVRQRAFLIPLNGPPRSLSLNIRVAAHRPADGIARLRPARRASVEDLRRQYTQLDRLRKGTERPTDRLTRTARPRRPPVPLSRASRRARGDPRGGPARVAPAHRTTRPMGAWRSPGPSDARGPAGPGLPFRAVA